ncbi:MAG: ATP-binding cassette domain-containing protein [Acetivibrio ethanolgignens]
MKASIILKDVSKAYNGQPVLSNLSFTLTPGSVTAITSPSGSGKTTLLRILMGLTAPDSGSIENLSQYKKSAVFQEDRLCDNLTALANIQLTAQQASRADILKAMELFGLSGCEKRLTYELSGGMKRRIAILRALFADYDLLLLDEPFKGLDSETKEIVIAETRRHSLGKTVVFTTHDRHELEGMEIKQEIRTL